VPTSLVAASSPNRGRRRTSLPPISATSPIRGSKSRARLNEATASDGDDNLPDLPFTNAARSQLFLAETIPPSSPGLEPTRSSLPSFVLQASPGTALSRIMSGAASRAAAADDDQVTALLFSDLSASNTPLSEAWTEGQLVGGGAGGSRSTTAVGDYDFTSLLASAPLTSTSSTNATKKDLPAPSSSGLTEAAVDLHLDVNPLTSSPNGGLFGSPSRWALLASPGKGGSAAGFGLDLPDADSAAMHSFLSLLRSSPPGGMPSPPAAVTGKGSEWYDALFGKGAGALTSTP
jgi:hypothetical protein